MLKTNLTRVCGRISPQADPVSRYPFVWLGPLLCGWVVAWSRMVCLAARIRRFDQRFHLLLNRSGVPPSPFKQTNLNLSKP